MHHDHHPDDEHHEAHDWNAQAEAYNALIDALEPELAKATQALLVAARVGPGQRVLDLACGPGHTSAAAAAAGATVLGLDSSAQMLAHAKTRFPGVPFELGDMNAPPAGPWDAIVCRLGGHHAPPTWIEAAVEALAPGGRLAIAEPDAVDDEARAKNMKTPAQWIALLESAGLEGVEATLSGADFEQVPPSVWSLMGDDMGAGRPRGPIYIVSGRKGDSS